MIVEVSSGKLRGREEDGVRLYAGIPYAEPPLRFRPPRPPRPWAGVRDATTFARGAPQGRRPRSELLHGPPPEQSEDCLTVNVWTPAGADRLPVIVWLHGGAFVSGHTSAPCYRADALAREGVVFVTVGYRLGSLGWLAHERLRDPETGACGNWGLLDHIAALGWVREHAAAFGGDPSNVTVAGQSAGALCAALLAGRRLAERAVVQSAVFDVPALDVSARWAEALAVEVCGELDPEALRACPASRLVEADLALASRPQFAAMGAGPFPCVDDAVVMSAPLEGTFPVPLLVGTNADEATFFFGPSPDVSNEQLVARVARLRPSLDPEAAVDTYREMLAADGRPADAASVWLSCWTDALFRAPTIALAARAPTAYTYLCRHLSALAGLGATHTVEVPLVFGTHRALASLVGRGEAVDALSRELVRAWATFARDGSPPSAWPASTEGRTTTFGGCEPLRAEPEAKDRLAVWDR